MGLITPTLTYDDLSDVDIAVEAVYENLDLKQEIFKSLDSVTKEHAILASNTCLLYTSPSPRDGLLSRMPSSA